MKQKFKINDYCIYKGFIFQIINIIPESSMGYERSGHLYYHIQCIDIDICNYFKLSKNNTPTLIIRSDKL